MSFPTKVISNFLSNDELSTVEELILKNTTGWIDYSNSSPPIQLSTYYVFDFYDPTFRPIYDIMAPKFQTEFGDIHVGQIHIFDSISPYNIHSDVQSGVWKNPAWTFIIPLDDYDSSTVVFNEGCNEKSFFNYTQETPSYGHQTISDEEYQKYFTHCDRKLLDWLTIEQAFKWRRGSLFAADRWKFHTSDNYIANGIKNKRAIIAWTNTKL